MADRRLRDRLWNVAELDGTPYDDVRDGVLVAVLMDIRDELQQINSRLDCSDTRSIPVTLRSIRRALAQPRKGKVKGGH